MHVKVFRWKKAIYYTVKGGIKTLYDSVLREWEFYFSKTDGYDNRNTIMKAFADFWNVSWNDRLEIPGRCVMGGKIFGRKGLKDGDEIFTSEIKTVERVGRDMCYNVRHDLMCATTVSGSKYYFYSDDHSAYMFLMLGDMIHTGKLSPGRDYYLRGDYHNSIFI